MYSIRGNDALILCEKSLNKNKTTKGRTDVEEDKAMYRRKLQWIMEKADLKTLKIAYRILFNMMYVEGRK